MIQIDLITGFLGAGKTTFLKSYASYWLEKGLRIGILENDFGAVNVDRMLLQELQGDKCEIEMISGGCDNESHRRRFRTKLIAMRMCGYDRVIVEPSGIYDVEEFFDVLRDEPLDEWYAIGNVISVVDAGLEEDISRQAEYIMATEAANAGTIVLSHADQVPEEQIEKTVRHLECALEQIDCKRQIRPCTIRCNLKQIEREVLDRIAACGYRIEDYHTMNKKDGIFDSVYLLQPDIAPDEVIPKVREVMENPDYGNIFRVKGFFCGNNGIWMQLNATRNTVDCVPVREGQDVLIIIGEKLNEAYIREKFGRRD